MLTLLKASFGIILRVFPDRSFLKKVSTGYALGVYALSLALTATSALLPTPLDTPNDTVLLKIMESAGADIAVFVFLLIVSLWILNKYARTKFTFKEFVILEALMFSGSNIVMSALGLFPFILGFIGVWITGIVVLTFEIYMLIIYRAAVSKIASISKSQATIVIVAPLLFVLIGVPILLFLIFLAGATSAKL